MMVLSGFDAGVNIDQLTRRLARHQFELCVCLSVGGEVELDQATRGGSSRWKHRKSLRGVSWLRSSTSR